MPLTTFRIEDFIGWPTGVNMGQFNGTNWIDNLAGGTSQFVAASTLFKSGKCLQVGQVGTDGSVDYTYTAVGAGLQVMCWNMVRTVNSDRDPTDANGIGLRLLNGTGVSLILRWGNAGVGLGNTFYVVEDNAGVRTTRFTSLNIYQPNIKYPFAWTYDATSKTFSLWINNVMVYSAILAALPNSNFTVERWGQFAAVQATGIMLVGDLFGYTDAAYVGPNEVRTGIPTADGPTQDWAFTGGATAWQSIDGVLTAVPAEHIEAAAAAEVSEFETPIDNTNVFQVFGALHRYYAARTDAGAIDMQGAIAEKAAWTNSPGATNQPPQTNYQFFEDRYGLTNPITGAAWTPGDLANMGVRYERTS